MFAHQDVHLKKPQPQAMTVVLETAQNAPMEHPINSFQIAASMEEVDDSAALVVKTIFTAVATASTTHGAVQSLPLRMLSFCLHHSRIVKLWIFLCFADLQSILQVIATIAHHANLAFHGKIL